MLSSFESGLWEMLAWVAIAAFIIFSIVVYQKKKKERLLAEKELEKQRKKRSQYVKQQKLKQEKKIEAAREKLANNEQKKAEKFERAKEEMAKKATVVWNGRIEHAKEKELFFKKIIDQTDQMPIRTAAGQVAFEWNEASRIANWTLEQVTMFVQRPSVTTKAREEAQEAIIEAMRIKESGINWTKEKGEELADKKEKARQEAQIEAKRLEAIKDEIENANLKWKAAERRASRWQNELQKISKTRM
ncbi:MAG: hypothetical protein MRY79_02810 [Alphaproteobacteria bacterium]|nr:hypothetical protein [Alphaproteobacteria bacterium]